MEVIQPNSPIGLNPRSDAGKFSPPSVEDLAQSSAALEKQLSAFRESMAEVPARLEALEGSAEKLTRTLDLTAEGWIKRGDEPYTAALAAVIVDRAEEKLTGGKLFGFAKFMLIVFVIMFGGGTVYFGFQIESVRKSSQNAIETIEIIRTSIQTAGGNVDSAASVIAAKLREAERAAAESTARSLTRVDSASSAALTRFQELTRQRQESVQASTAVVADARNAAVAALSRSSQSGQEEMQRVTDGARDSLGVALAVIAAMRDTALYARLAGRDSVTIRVDVGRTSSLLSVILGAVALAVALASFIAMLRVSRRHRLRV
jgi:hypothetical protein